ncbi:MAG: thiamine pyrophosphate-binding protein [Alphaproteobacteria bacterium]|nr:thiamine pyrophosphate-binding protein [Alphaproteobacteria bacterium]
MRGADILVQTLAKAGVSRIFSLSGNQIMPVYDACIDAGITIHHTRHEASAVFMADAWAQLTGELGVALVTAAPGFANAMGALFTALHSESPVLLLSGDSPRAHDGRGAFQELDQVAVSRPLTKHSLRLTAIDAVAEETAAAIHIAVSGRPGPVHIALPFDVLLANSDHHAHASVPRPRPDRPTVDQEDLAAVTNALAAAERPLVITGPVLNRTRAGDLIAALERKHHLPVLSLESPRGLNDPSLGRLAAALTRADLVISLGKRIDYTLALGAADKLGAERKWIVADVDSRQREAARRNLGDRLIIALEADPRALAEALATGPETAPQRGDWLAAVANLTRERSFEAGSAATSGPISSHALSAAVQRQIDKAANPLLIIDGGEFGQWAQAVCSAGERLINGTSAAIGGMLCYALGARCARPGATIFALMGDGTVGFQFAEFETAVREKLPFVVVIGNDECWNAEHQIQLRDYGAGRLIGCQLSEARYDLAAAGLGGHGEYVTDLADLDAALERALLSGLPACVNVRIKGAPAPTLTGGPAH